MTNAPTSPGAVRTDPLPIETALPALTAALRGRPAAVLVAPPGAGKTTRVPLALLDQPWVAGGKVVLLEPRRLAARGAAERMAAALGEDVGETVGLRARFDTAISARTRVEVVTEGVFTRLVQADPSLDGVAAVLFDEYHERSLDADLGLALALDVAGALRPDLRLLVMSATLDGARVAALLDDAPVIESRGRAFPIETRYLGRDPAQRIEEAVASAAIEGLRGAPGSVLAFLPGQAEIGRAAAWLEQRLKPAEALVVPLHGGLDKAAQDRAVRPARDGTRKIVLATSIAESALTIDGVRVVVDSGLARVPRYEPDLGLTRLETVRASRASVDQRRGRAGRTAPGLCLRLWEEAGTGALPPFARPEVLDADLSGPLLQLALWGTRDPGTLRWLDPPPEAAVTEARALLREIGALDRDGAITAAGRAVAALAAPPRIARMVIEAARRGAAILGAEVAAVLIERGLGGTGVELEDRLDRWRRDRSARAEAARGLARSFARQAKGTAASTAVDRGADLTPAQALALAYPDRIAKARRDGRTFLLANGRAAAVEAASPLAGPPFLAVGEIAGRAAASRILLAAPLTLAEVEAVAGDGIETGDEVTFDERRQALSARRVRRFGAIVLAEAALPVTADEGAARILAAGLLRGGAGRLPWSDAAGRLRDRVAFLHAAAAQSGAPNPWPDLSDPALSDAAEEWLVPALVGKSALADLSAEDLDHALRSRLPFDLLRRLEDEAPTHWQAPTGSRHAVDYGAEGGPAVSVRVQEVFGLDRHPALAGGRVPLVLNLLSPAHRPVQVTRDLPGFWRGSWAAVRAEMRGRYPRHPWPDDPAAAPPTTRAKPRGT